jgi:arylsulfatase
LWLLLAGTGILVALLVLVAARVTTRHRPPGKLGDANLLIVVIDAARADHVGCYGYRRDTTPNLDRLAQESFVFEQHFAPYSQTLPTTVSLLTGLHPDTHLARGRNLTDEDLWTLEKGLSKRGYRTAFFSSNPVASPLYGVGTDFETICAAQRHPTAKGEQGSEAAHSTDPYATPEGLLDAFRGWLSSQTEAPFLAYLHFLPPHIPYLAPEDCKREFADREPPGAWQGDFVFPQIEPRERGREPPPLREWVNLYDANLRWADSAVGRVEQLLREGGMLEDTLLIVTSDHGEAFREHGYKFHGRGVFDELLHIPLIVRLPGETPPAGRFQALTQTVDLLPTILDLLGEPRFSALQGRSLAPVFEGGQPEPLPFVFATCGGTESYLVRNQTHALILFEGGVHRALYDLAQDPRQTRNVLTEQPEVAERMVAAFRQFTLSQRRPRLDFIDPKAEVVPLASARKVKLTQEQRRALEVLGYVD